MKSALKVAVSVILLAVIFYTLGGVKEVCRVISSMNLLYVVPILLVSTLDRVLMTYKWTLLLRSRGLHLSFLTGMKIYCASMVWGTVLPTTVGADAVRAVATSRQKLDFGEVVASIVMERLAGFVSALLLAVVGLTLLSLLGLFPPHAVWLWAGAVFLMAASVGLLVISMSQRAFDLVHERFLARFRNSKAVQRLRQFHTSYRGYRDNKKVLAVFFLLTFAEQWFPIVFAWLIALSLHVKVDFLLVAGVFPLTMLLARIPVGIDAIGVFEGIFAVLMSLAGVSAADSVAVALLGRILQLLSWMPWWLAHVFPAKSFRPPGMNPVGNTSDVRQ